MAEINVEKMSQRMAFLVIQELRDNGVFVGRWIPVSERLPEEDGQYLITVKYKHVNDSYEDVYAEHGEWYNGRWDMFLFGHCGEVEDIIAWMPLPEPYKAESEEV